MKGSQSSNAHTLSPSDEVRNLVKRILMDLRFRNKLVGTQYLEEAILLKFADPATHAMAIYETIALRHGTNRCNVEKAIRNTIRDCFYYGRWFRMKEFLLQMPFDEKYPPTISDFVVEFALRLRYIADDRIYTGAFVRPALVNGL